MSTTTIHRFESHLLILAVIAFLTYNTWRTFGLAGIILTDRFTYAPYAYRLNWYVVKFLSQVTSLSIVTCMAVMWIGSMSAVYILLRPNEYDTIIFLGWLIAICMFGTIYDGEAFVLLVLLVKYQDNRYSPFLLIPLILFKEEIAFIALVYLLLYKIFTKELVISAGCSGLLYLVFRLLIGEVPYPSFVPFFTPPVLLSFFLNTSYFITWVPMSVALIVLTCDLKYKWLWIITSIPIFLFALFWEPHLWFPLILIQMNNVIKKEAEE